MSHLVGLFDAPLLFDVTLQHPPSTFTFHLDFRLRSDGNSVRSTVNESAIAVPQGEARFVSVALMVIGWMVDTGVGGPCLACPFASGRKQAEKYIHARSCALSDLRQPRGQMELGTHVNATFLGNDPISAKRIFTVTEATKLQAVPLTPIPTPQSE
ncbi:unnamed protein product [Dibothriocephalus latus]|uniref:Uncharacterized protein n=1 Tax=Dibothriocephalus latus TaxID=60516 RepID=A0A3P6U011_DIBLA|nr:unnamed protein product [Dibothriocephalus latus]